jgi:signal transduction histidine kinase
LGVFGNAAHQLRTPLTLLRAKIEDVAEPRLRAELVRDIRRLTSLVSAMLDLARLQIMRLKSGLSIWWR